MASRADIKRLVKEARKQGWDVDYTKKGHIRFRPPSGEILIASSTPSCSRTYRNTKAQLKKAGLRV